MTKRLFTVRWFYSLSIFAVLVSCLGCSSTLDTEYGKSRGTAGDRSINGFGVLRRSYEKNGWTTREVNRLNDRLANVDAIVWMPQYRDSLYDNATAWFDHWLSEKTRTLVYIVPDDGCEIRYFQAARQLASNAQQLEYRRHIARLETDRLLERLHNESLPSNGWFVLERLNDAAVVHGDKGDMPVDYKVVPATVTVAPNASGTTTTAPTPAYAHWRSYTNSKVKVEHETLVSSDDGSPVIVRVTADEWKDSELIVVASGSMLCNYSLATPPGQAIASQVINETSSQPGVIGFLTTDYSGAQVSDVDPEINSVTGMELFTVWPLSLVMLHLVVIGFVACMILLPIFGRPRETPAASASDFADHLDAVALLMNKSGGEEYARRRVSDYMRRIRGETTGPWVLPDVKPHTTPVILPRPDDVVLAIQTPDIAITKETP